MRILLICSVMLLSGCLYSLRSVEIGYRFDGEAGNQLSGYEISVSDFSDIRSVANPQVVAHARDQFGSTTSGGWRAERPISDILRDAIAEGLAAGGANVPDGESRLVLSGEIVSYDQNMTIGFWKVNVSSMLTVRMQLMDSATGQIVWRDTVIGTTQADHNAGDRTAVIETFVACLDDFVQKLATNEYFIQQLQGTRN